MPLQHGRPSASAAYEFLSGAQWSVLVQQFGVTAKGLASARSLSPLEAQAVDGMVQLVHDLAFDVPHKCIMFQMISALPGGHVARHRDLRQVFSFTHRFNVVLATNPEAHISTFHMKDGAEVEAKHYEPVGTLYELNNRIPHLAKNDGETLFTVGVLDFIAADYPALKPDDWEKSILTRRCDLHLQADSTFIASTTAVSDRSQL